jgi:hypothetical protein
MHESNPIDARKSEDQYCTRSKTGGKCIYRAGQLPIYGEEWSFFLRVKSGGKMKLNMHPTTR